MLNIAHRGGGSIAPENTLEAADKAFKNRAHMWELDVQLTAEGVPILMHDDSLQRTTDVEGVFPDRTDYCVNSFFLAEIKELDAGSWFIETDPFGEIARGKVPQAALRSYKGTEVPTLKEALELTKSRGWRVNVELKTGEGNPIAKEKRKTLVHKVAEVIGEVGPLSRIVVSSFEKELLKDFKCELPEIELALIIDGPVEDPYKDRSEVWGGLNFPASAIEDGKLRHQLRELASSGTKIMLWTINDRDNLRKVARTSWIEGIITDYPQRLTQIAQPLD